MATSRAASLSRGVIWSRQAEVPLMGRLVASAGMRSVGGRRAKVEAHNTARAKPSWGCPNGARTHRLASE